jgi:hypothetical protein
VLSRYVRDRQSLTLPEAIRKMSLMPAQRLEALTPEAKRLGRLQAGARADIVVFHAGSVTDRATFRAPTEPSEGVRYLVVDGTVVVDDGKFRDTVFPGQALLARPREQSGHPAGTADMEQFAVRYSGAWSSGDPERVAAFHAEDGSLSINGGTPAVGRAGITEAARSFMTAYPDMIVELDRLEYRDGKYRYHWRFTGTNSGPGGTGRAVRTAGYEEWTIGATGLIASSEGHYDAAEWDRQLGKAP